VDDLAQFNQERWTALVEAGIEFGQPFKDFDAAQAFDYLDRWANIGRLGFQDFKDQRILCLASGGGQQSVCFGLLGAQVTVLDLTPAQLEGDRHMAMHYGLEFQLEQGDMRDLSRFESGSFDLVFQAYSINFVPDPELVFAEVARVLGPEGKYYLQYGNPLWSMEPEDWTDKGYPIRQPYEQGAKTGVDDGPWDVPQADGSTRYVEGPREFLHTLGTLYNGLGRRGLHIFAMFDGPAGDSTATPGSWEHLKSYLPVWPAVWAVKSESLWPSVAPASGA
jgi:SAM-dependent methyltransferase